MKRKRLYPFTDYAPKTEARLKRLFALGERGALRRCIQDATIAGVLGFIPYRIFGEKKTATIFSDDEIRKLYPRAEIIKRGLGGVLIEPEAKTSNRPPKITSKAPRITPKTPRLR